MKRFGIITLGLMAAAWAGAPAVAADAPAPSPSQSSQAQAPEVPPAAPGIFTAQKRGAMKFHLTVTGHDFTSREAIEKYLAYRAAELTLGEHDQWFTLSESRAKGDTVPATKPDPAGLRYSFRMEYWRPLWRYKTAAPTWNNWSPFSGAAFFAADPKTVTAYEASADIVLHKGAMADDNPLAFDASAVSDLLVNQVSPPK